MTLEQAVIEQDHELEESATQSNDALVRHRWHWTLDEENPERVSLREYARLVGRAFSTISGQANGYAAWIATDRRSPITEAIKRAEVSEEKEAVIDAVAKARGVTFQTAQRSRQSEVRRTRALAREAAERKGTTVQEEAPRIAEMAARVAEAQNREQVERVARRTLRYVEMERLLLSALRPLNEAVRLAGIAWSEEERELLKTTVQNIRQVLTLLDGRITGIAPIDWDAELTAIMEAVS